MCFVKIALSAIPKSNDIFFKRLRFSNMLSSLTPRGSHISQQANHRLESTLRVGRVITMATWSASDKTHSVWGCPRYFLCWILWLCHQWRWSEFRPLTVAVVALDQHRGYKGPPLTGTIRLFWISWQNLWFIALITNSHTFPYILNAPHPSTQA